MASMLHSDFVSALIVKCEDFCNFIYSNWDIWIWCICIYFCHRKLKAYLSDLSSVLKEKDGDFKVDPVRKVLSYSELLENTLLNFGIKISIEDEKMVGLSLI